LLRKAGVAVTDTTVPISVKRKVAYRA
jgi:hypothetical protein